MYVIMTPGIRIITTISQFVVVAAFSWFIINLAQLLLKNRKKHRYLQDISPQLPVVKCPNLIHGHYLATMAQSRNYQIINELHKEHGSSFGLYNPDQPWVMTCDLDLIKLALIDEGSKHINRPLINIGLKEFTRSIMQAEDDEWRQIRRVVSPSMTNHRVRGKQAVGDICNSSDKLINSVDRRLKDALMETGSAQLRVDISYEMRRFAISVIFSLFYKQADVIDFDSPEDPLTKLAELGLVTSPGTVMRIPVILPFTYGICDWLVSFTNLGKLRVTVAHYLDEAMKSWSSVKKKDMPSPNEGQEKVIDLLIKAYKDGKIKKDMLEGTTFVLLLAGFETTAYTLACLVGRLANNPDVQEKLRAEVARDGLDCDYLTWCILETLRLNPAVPLGVGRVLIDDVVSPSTGLLIPKGTFLSPSVYTVHRDPDVWKEPLRWFPDRWAEKSKFHPASFAAFGFGQRNCVGGKLAMQEIKMLMSKLLAKYRFRKRADTPEEFDFTSPLLIVAFSTSKIYVDIVPYEEAEEVEI